MCGIAGYLFHDHDRPSDPELLARLGRAIRHRGPDGEGLWFGPGVGLAHRRLAIIDLEGGRQPLANEDGLVQVVFNGEIYNYLELRAELLRRGHVFRTRSDTEVMVHLYEEMGPRLVERLRGMFAFAIWDGRCRRLLLARDRLGIKPLYWYQDAGQLLFGSELKSILADASVPRDLDPAAIEDYLAYGAILGERSILGRIRRLLPGHTLVIDQAGWRPGLERYWRLEFRPDPRPSAAEWQEAVRAKVAETVQAHLVADVPVGAFLSGGMDSSIVVAACAGMTNGPMRTFSMGFHEEAYSELPHARRVAQAFGSLHTEELVTPDAVQMLEDLALYYDEPFADASAIPTFLVSRLAARQVKVVLSGDGGDEAFAGYARHAHDLREAGWRRRLPRWLRQGVLAPLGRAWPQASWLPRPLRAKTRLVNLSLDPGPAYANTLAQCRLPLRRRLLAPHLAACLTGHRPEEQVCAAYAGAPADDPLAGMLAADTATVLPDDFLVKVDRASMANGLEVRPPFLDHELLELAARIPSSFKVRRGQTKWILREAYRRQLPPEIIARPKQGFEIPLDQWLRGPLAALFEDQVLSPGAKVGGLIDQGLVRRLFRAHRLGAGRHGQLLWSILVLERWAERYLDVANQARRGERHASHAEI